MNKYAQEETQHTMPENYFDAGFDFEAYIRERLLEIKDTDDRAAMKDLMEKVMVPFYKNTEEQYNALVKSICTEESRQKCDIVTAIAKKQQVDVTDHFLFPMCAADMAKSGLTEPRIYINADRAAVDRIKREQRVFQGRICSKYGEYAAGFVLKPVSAYTDRLRWLYKVFERSGQAWKSVCAPHLDRFFDVVRVSGELPEGEELTAVYVNLDEYADFVWYDYIPLWNIEVTKEKSSAYPRLAVDQIQYVHSIYSTRLHAGSEYLVENDGVCIWKTKRLPDGLEITCDSPDPQIWNLVAFHKAENQEKQDKEKTLYSNAGNEYAYEGCTRTMGEVRRFVSGLGYEDRLILEDIVPVDSHYKGSGLTYSMDSFIEDEICRAAPDRKLLFRFQPYDDGDALNYDILSYLLSRVQWELPQFACIGELVH